MTQLTFLERDDAMIAYRQYGDGEPVMLVHSGTGSGPFDWRHQIPALAHTHRVIVPDMRGHADSSDAPLSLAALTADLKALGEQLDAFPAHLLGSSHGSFPAIALALAHPELVRSVAIIGSVWSDDHLPPDLDDDIVAQWPQALRRLHPRHGERHWEELLRRLIDDRRHNVEFHEDDFAQMQMPLLVAQGDRDPFLHPEMSVTAACAAPEGELLIIPGAGHAAHIEAPEVFNHSYLRFLTAVNPAAGDPDRRRARPPGVTEQQETMT